jgi:hypothetical protein
VTRKSDELAELLRAALRTSTGDDQADELARASLLAGVVGDDPELLRVFQEETGPTQAELDLHLPGVEGDPHATRADWFGTFVNRMGVAVKDVSKSMTDKSRMAVALRVVAPAPGSVRVVLKAPIAPEGEAEIERVGDGQSVESKALRTVAVLMDLAERGSQEPGETPLTSAAQKLSGQARKSVRAVATSVARAGWDVEGELRQRGQAPESIRLSASGALSLIAEMDKRVETTRPEIIVGRIDGQRHSLGTMWLLPEGKRRAVEAFVADDSLLSEVAELGANPERLVRGEFLVSVTFPEGDAKSPTESYELLRITPVDEFAQDEIDLSDT